MQRAAAVRLSRRRSRGRRGRGRLPSTLTAQVCSPTVDVDRLADGDGLRADAVDGDAGAWRLGDPGDEHAHRALAEHDDLARARRPPASGSASPQAPDSAAWPRSMASRVSLAVARRPRRASPTRRRPAARSDAVHREPRHARRVVDPRHEHPERAVRQDRGLAGGVAFGAARSASGSLSGPPGGFGRRLGSGLRRGGGRSGGVLDPVRAGRRARSRAPRGCVAVALPIAAPSDLPRPRSAR